MTIITEFLAFVGAADRRSRAWQRDIPIGRHGAKAAAVCCVAGVLALIGCAPDVVDLRNAPQATQDAMLQVRVLPLGMPAPPDAGSISPISGYGCGQTSEAASDAAVRQIRVKALRLHATAVVDVLIGPADAGVCLGGYKMVATGIAAGPRGIPPTY